MNLFKFAFIVQIGILSLNSSVVLAQSSTTLEELKRQLELLRKKVELLEKEQKANIITPQLPDKAKLSSKNIADPGKKNNFYRFKVSKF